MTWDDNPSPANTRNGHVLYVATAKVYTMNGPKKPLLVSIEHQMPHVKNKLGPGEEGGTPSPSIGVMVDSCASLSISQPISR